MKTKISIRDCRKAIERTGGLYLMGSTGEPLLITELKVVRGKWVSGDAHLTRAGQEYLTRMARSLLAGPAPPKISIRDCQKAIEVAGGIPVTMRGEDRIITEVATGGPGSSRWFSGEMRYTEREQRLLTQAARDILERR